MKLVAAAFPGFILRKLSEAIAIKASGREILKMPLIDQPYNLDTGLNILLRTSHVFIESLLRHLDFYCDLTPARFDKDISLPLLTAWRIAKFLDTRIKAGIAQCSDNAHLGKLMLW